MFSIQQCIENEYGGKNRIIYGRIEHAAISGAGVQVLDYSEQGAVGYLILGVTYTTKLVTGVTNQIKINGQLYVNYAAISQLASYIPSIHYEKSPKLRILCTEADMVGCIDFQVISLE